MTQQDNDDIEQQIEVGDIVTDPCRALTDSAVTAYSRAYFACMLNGGKHDACAKTGTDAARDVARRMAKDFDLQGHFDEETFDFILSEKDA